LSNQTGSEEEVKADEVFIKRLYMCIKLFWFYGLSNPMGLEAAMEVAA